MSMLTSVNNPSIKAARALKAHKARLESGLHLAEGPKALGELLAFMWYKFHSFGVRGCRNIRF